MIPEPANTKLLYVNTGKSCAPAAEKITVLVLAVNPAPVPENVVPDFVKVMVLVFPSKVPPVLISVPLIVCDKPVPKFNLLVAALPLIIKSFAVIFPVNVVTLLPVLENVIFPVVVNPAILVPVLPFNVIFAASPLNAPIKFPAKRKLAVFPLNVAAVFVTVPVKLIMAVLAFNVPLFKLVAPVIVIVLFDASKVPPLSVSVPLKVCVRAAPILRVPFVSVNAAPEMFPLKVAVPEALFTIIGPVVVKPLMDCVPVPFIVIPPAREVKVPLFIKFPPIVNK